MFYDKKKDECRTEEVNGVFSDIVDVAQVLEESKSRNSKKGFDVAAFVELSREKSNSFMAGLKQIEDYIKQHRLPT